MCILGRQGGRDRGRKGGKEEGSSNFFRRTPCIEGEYVIDNNRAKM